MKRRDAQLILDIRDYLDENLYQEHSIRELCQKFMINREKMQAGFHEFLHSTVHAYIVKQRIERAAQRLLESDDSIKAIAVESGYKKQRSFNELRRHSAIDSAFTPPDTGVYYAVVTDMQSYATRTNKISINSPYSGTASIDISATATSTAVCTPITFTASSANFGQDPSFKWQVSGVPAGGDSTTYSYNLFANGDQVYCILTTPSSFRKF